MDDINISIEDIEFDEEHCNTEGDLIQHDVESEPICPLEEHLSEHEVQPQPSCPSIGMCFQSVDEVKSFYRQYAISKGFGVRTRSSRKNKENELCYFMMVCSRAGKYVSPLENQINSRPTKTCDCQARIIVVRRDGNWYISAFHDVHSHDLTPTKSRMFRGNKRMNLHVKRMLDLNTEAGVRINKTFRALVCGSDGYQNMEFSEQDVRNYVGKQRRALTKHGDAKALLKHFTAMRELNRDFFYEIDVDDDNRILNVFWADARSRAACQYFGDVICFDTTYLTNKYDMPFAPFVGVNHHGQSILLGCGLLSSEDTSSFVWVFDCWLRCMSNKAPQGIITDQCKAMKKAIDIVFPNTRHRWCLWHIMKKIPEKLHGYSAYKDINEEVKKVVYNSDSVPKFLYRWERMISHFSLHDNEWLSSLFEERQKWVPCYLRDHFWAGMSTTQRSESMNAFFDGYINSQTTLQVFVEQYDNALHHKIEKEAQADFTSLNTTIRCGSESLIERQFQKHYTHSKFAEIQTEFRGKINCFINDVVVDGSSCLYKVIQDSIHDGVREEREFVVLFNRDTNDVSCSCLLFEFRGIICRHCLSVLAQERVTELPAKYILQRWSKTVRRKHTYITAAYKKKEKDPHIQRYDKLCSTFHNLAEIACESEDMTQQLIDMLSSFAGNHGRNILIQTSMNDNVDIAAHDHNHSQPCSNVETNTVHQNIQSPRIVKRKGRPRSKRLQSTCEKLTRRKTSSKVNSSSYVKPMTANTTVVDFEQECRLSSIGFVSLLTSLENDVNNTQMSTT